MEEVKKLDYKEAKEKLRNASLDLQFLLNVEQNMGQDLEQEFQKYLWHLQKVYSKNQDFPWELSHEGCELLRKFRKSHDKLFKAFLKVFEQLKEKQPSCWDHEEEEEEVEMKE